MNHFIQLKKKKERKEERKPGPQPIESGICIAVTTHKPPAAVTEFIRILSK